MSQYISGRKPFLNIGIPGITTNTPVLDITGRVGIGTTNPTVALDVIGDGKFSGIVIANNAWIGVATINDLKVVNDTFRVGTIITMSNGIITATTFDGKFLDFENVKVSGVTTFTNGPVLIGSGTSTGSASQPLQVTGSAYVSGNIGLGSINPTSKLFVVGDGYFTGVITATEFKGNASTATYATDAGIATNLKGGVANNLPYQSSPNTTSFISNGFSGTFLKSNGSTFPPSWEFLPPPTINVAETTSTLVNFPLFIDATGNTGTLSINSSLFSFVPQSNDPRLGIGTGSPNFNLDVNGKGRFIGTVSASAYFGTNSNISGITTIGVGNTGVKIDGTTGIITSINPSTTVTFVGNLTGTASTASFATTAFSLNGVIESNLNVAYASKAGVSTDVIGGIASVTSLSVDTTGISTLGTVKISSGIITSSIVGSSVTYYGDGSKLTGVSGVKVEFQDLVGDPVYLTLANNSGVSSIGIVTSGDSALVFIPSSGSLGIGTVNPTEKLQIQGNISINGTTSYGSITTTTATISQIDIHSSISTSIYRSVEYTIQATQGNNYHATKIIAIHDGTFAYNSEYGVVYNNISVSSFDVDLSGGNIRLLATPASSSLTKYNINFIATKI